MIDTDLDGSHGLLASTSVPGPSAHAAPPAAAYEMQHQAGGATLRLVGAWTLAALAPQYQPMQRALMSYAQDPAVTWDLGGLTALDDAGALLLLDAWAARRPRLAAVKPEHAALLAALEAARPPPRRRERLAPVTRMGFGAIALAQHLRGLVELAGQLVLDLLAILRGSQAVPWREVSANVHRTGGQALPITALVGFLVGVVLSYLSALQLRAYGADVYIVNVLGIGIVRELGPLLAAILVAGRSGSSMTAQLGVMRVTQELDALSVMGISHTLRLVLPKVVALAITLPLLVLWTDTIALIGGGLVAQGQLGIPLPQFLQGLPNAVPMANLWIGFGKAMLFGALIALVACHYGLRIAPNTQSLGRNTTSSVVTAITIVIVFDAIIAVAFSDVGV